VVALDLPVKEFVSFVFVIDRMSIVFREQLVRHREAGYWMQSGRIRDITGIDPAKDWYIPDDMPAHKQKEFIGTCEKILNDYADLINSGVRLEDASMILPTNMTHRGAMTIHLRALCKIMAARCCVIAQPAMWAPVISGIRTSLENYEPWSYYKDHYGETGLWDFIFAPPCFRNEAYTGCPYQGENQRRVVGEDPLPPCSVWTANRDGSQHKHVRSEESKKYVKPFVELWGPKVSAILLGEQ